MSGRPGARGRGQAAGRQLPAPSVLAAIDWLLLDVDGVLTDGLVHFDAEGREYKSFHVHDAAGIVFWHRCGGHSGFVSGRGGEVVTRRARELGVEEVHLGRTDKAAVFEELLVRRQLRPAQVAFVGDDLLDLPVLRSVALAATVPECRPEVRAVAHFVADRPAGHGAVRTVVELLLRARGVWDGVVARNGLP